MLQYCSCVLHSWFTKYILPFSFRIPKRFQGTELEKTTASTWYLTEWIFQRQMALTSWTMPLFPHSVPLRPFCLVRYPPMQIKTAFLSRPRNSKRWLETDLLHLLCQFLLPNQIHRMPLGFAEASAGSMRFAAVEVVRATGIYLRMCFRAWIRLSIYNDKGPARRNDRAKIVGS